MNLSNYNHRDEGVNNVVSVGTVFLTLFLCAVIILSIGGNLLVCIAVTTDRQLRKRSNFLYVSLAFADLILSFLVMPFGITHEWTKLWIFGKTFCNIYLSCDVMSSTASILNLCAIAFDRYMQVRNPFSYSQKMNRLRFCAMIVMIWVCSTLISFIPIHMQWHRSHIFNTSAISKTKLHHDDIINDCLHVSTATDEEKVCNLELNPTYALVSSTISFFLPCAVMLGLYVRLFIYAQKHTVKIRKQVKPAPAQNIASPFNNSSAQVNNSFEPASCYNIPVGQQTARYSVCSANTIKHQNNKKMISLENHKAAVTLGIIMGTFTFCWLPFFIVNVCQALCHCVPDELFKTVTWLGYFNSCANPVIYSVFNTDFRNAFKKILCSRKKINLGRGLFRNNEVYMCNSTGMMKCLSTPDATMSTSTSRNLIYSLQCNGSNNNDINTAVTMDTSINGSNHHSDFQSMLSHAPHR